MFEYLVTPSGADSIGHGGMIVWMTQQKFRSPTVAYIGLQGGPISKPLPNDKKSY